MRDSRSARSALQHGAFRAGGLSRNKRFGLSAFSENHGRGSCPTFPELIPGIANRLPREVNDAREFSDGSALGAEHGPDREPSFRLSGRDRQPVDEPAMDPLPPQD